MWPSQARQNHSSREERLGYVRVKFSRVTKEIRFRFECKDLQSVKLGTMWFTIDHYHGKGRESLPTRPRHTFQRLTKDQRRIPHTPRERVYVRSNSGLQLGISLRNREYLAGASFIYGIALHSFFLFHYYGSYRSNHIHRLRVAGNWKPGTWFTNPDIFCKQQCHQQRAKRDAIVADHQRFIGNNYCDCRWRSAHRDE